jgi:hypothetical protein
LWGTLTFYMRIEIKAHCRKRDAEYSYYFVTDLINELSGNNSVYSPTHTHTHGQQYGRSAFYVVRAMQKCTSVTRERRGIHFFATIHQKKCFICSPCRVYTAVCCSSKIIHKKNVKEICKLIFQIKQQRK